jgi:hypothetical protein
MVGSTLARPEDWNRLSCGIRSRWSAFLAMGGGILPTQSCVTLEVANFETGPCAGSQSAAAQLRFPDNDLSEAAIQAVECSPPANEFGMICGEDPI